jgi:hypothetical protein
MIIKALIGWLICAPAVQIMPQEYGNYPYQVEKWRPLVELALEDYGIPEQTDTFLRVMQCESMGDSNAKNPTSTASGLMQHLARPYWPARAEAIGMPDSSPFNPIANVYASAWLLTVRHGGWQHWTCY